MDILIYNYPKDSLTTIPFSLMEMNQPSSSKAPSWHVVITKLHKLPTH